MTLSPWEQFRQDFSDKRVLIFGLGLLGRGVGDAQIFCSLGAKVTITDQKPASALATSLQHLEPYHYNSVFGHHPLSLLDQTDCIIRNPSVPYHHPLLDEARRRLIPIYMDACLFFQYAQPPQSVGITGTRGKSTTTALIQAVLSQAGHSVITGGNAYPGASLELLQSYDSNNWYVFELSSWDLQAFHDAKLSPHLAIFTSLYPDHLLDRSYEQYQNDKTAIFSYQSPQDALIFNSTQAEVAHLAATAVSTTIPYSDTTLPASIQIKLPGPHNRLNAAAAFTLAQHLKLDRTQTLATLSNFKPLPSRLEPIRTVSGITFINDSTSTTPAALIAALNTFPQQHFIIGGTTKKLPTKDLITSLNTQAKALYLLSGSGTAELTDHLAPHLIHHTSSSLEELVNLAYQTAQPGDTIVFSPGFTSFELFDNEFHRAKVYNQLVSSLPVK